MSIVGEAIEASEQIETTWTEQIAIERAAVLELAGRDPSNSDRSILESVIERAHEAA